MSGQASKRPGRFVFNCEICGRFSSERAGGRYIVQDSPDGGGGDLYAEVCYRHRIAMRLPTRANELRSRRHEEDDCRQKAYQAMVRERNATKRPLLAPLSPDFDPLTDAGFFVSWHWYAEQAKDFADAVERVGFIY